MDQTGFMALAINPRTDDLAQHGHAAGSGRGLDYGIDHVDVLAQDLAAQLDEGIGHGLGCLFAQDRPIHVWAQFLTRHGLAPQPCLAFDDEAMLGGDTTPFVFPLTDGGSRDV